jgi:putative monooxygenase
VSDVEVRKVALADVPVNRQRGGEIRVLLSPATVQATSGFFGVLTLAPGDFVSEHYHPYSEEFIYVVEGSLAVRIGGAQEVFLDSGEGLLVPKKVRHRIVNRGTGPATVPFHLSPLAPRPELGHVDTEPLPPPNTSPIDVGGPA